LPERWKLNKNLATSAEFSGLYDLALAKRPTDARVRDILYVHSELKPATQFR